MENELRRAGGAAGVEVGGDIAGSDFSAADQAVRRLLADQGLKGVDGIRLVAWPIDLNDRLQLLQFAAYFDDLIPDVTALRWSKRDQHLGPGRLQDLGDLMRFEQGVHGIGNAGCFGAEQRDETLRQ